jgi:hypothetical protein
VASFEYEAMLTSLGAEVTKCFGDHLSYYITTSPTELTSVNIQKRHLAAELLGIPVVSPKWVEQCKVDGKLLDVGQFIVTGRLCATELENPTLQGATTAENIPTISDLLVATEPAAEQILRAPSRRVSSAALAAEPLAVTATGLPRPISTLSLTPSLPRSRSADSVAKAEVLLPSFREIAPPVVPAEVLEKVQKRRRSERICDLQESDSDEELFSSSLKRSKSAAEFESWEAISKISAQVPLQVYYEAGQEGDVLQITPVVLDSGARCRATASGIKGLTVKGKKEQKGASGGAKTGKGGHSGSHSAAKAHSAGSKGATVDKHSKTAKVPGVAHTVAGNVSRTAHRLPCGTQCNGDVLATFFIFSRPISASAQPPFCACSTKDQGGDSAHWL